MNTKGQGALEYLLIIGGAVIVAAILVYIIQTNPTPTEKWKEEWACSKTEITCTVVYDNIFFGQTTEINYSTCENWLASYFKYGTELQFDKEKVLSANQNEKCVEQTKVRVPK